RSARRLPCDRSRRSGQVVNTIGALCRYRLGCRLDNRAAWLGHGLHPQGQAPQLDEALRGIVREDVARTVGGQVGLVERVGRAAADYRAGATAQLDAYGARDVALRADHVGSEVLAEGRVPGAVVHGLRIGV